MSLAGLSREELVGRARALQPALRERAKEAAALRRLPDATIADMQEAGLFRVLQPARFGGAEHHPMTFFEVQTALAEACPSTAWVYGVVAVHAWQLALFADEAQQEVWGDDPTTLISSSYMPVGKLTAAEGGWRLSGRWSFSSGSDHCQWIFLGGFCPTGPDAKGPDMRTFLLPRSDYSIKDVWHTSGLRGTGSNDIVVDDVFVPEHRTHKLIHGFFRKSPGNLVNPSALYKVPFGQLFVRSVSTTAIGLTAGALQAYLQPTRDRVAQSDGSAVRLEVTAQEVAARAAATVDEVKLVLKRNIDQLMAWAEAGDDMPLDRRIAFRLDSSRTVERCMAVVDELFTASGGRAIFEDHPLNRFWLDIHAARAHYANNPTKPARNLGGTLLGLKNTDFFL